METPEEVPLAPPQENELRHRKPKKKKRLQWIVNHDDSQMEKPSPAQEQVFLTMQLRKMVRRVHGRKVQGSLGAELCTLVVLVVIIFVFAVAAENHYEFEEASNDTQTVTVALESDDTPTVVFILVVVLWILLAFIIISKSPFSPWWRMLKWMVLYLPLLHAAAAFAWYENGDAEHVVAALFVFFECAVFVGFVGFYKIYPMCLKKQCFSKNKGQAAKLWRVGVISDWTMSYAGFNHDSIQRCKATFTCKYEGETCPKTGLPSGLGRWLDDAWEGEMITGYWKEGQPVAPFSSWSYGTDDAVAAVRVAYFNATDDVFDKNVFHASNAESTPTCGVASVECSVSGSFYNHLPEATVIEGPYERDPNTDYETTPGCYSNAIRHCIQDLDPIQTEVNAEDANHGWPNIEIRAMDNRGIQVVGHTYQPTGSEYANGVDSITVQVNRSVSRNSAAAKYNTLARSSAMRLSRNSLFLPKRPSKRNSFFGKLVMVDIEEGNESDSEDSFHSVHETTDEKNESEAKRDSDTKPPARLSEQCGIASLQVQDWVPAEHKEAVIFLAGYNSCTKDRLENFGQFLAMSKLSSKVYPFVFAWPGGVGPGYFEASKVSGTAKNFDNLLKLVASIRAAGIRTVNFMTHSMGAQSLMGAFHDEYDENGVWQGRSKLSQCFQLDPAFVGDDRRMEDSDDREQKLICKTITMMNPDFPLEAFVNRGFLTIRRVCRIVTVVGDRNDKALWWSSVFNGTAERYGYRHWDGLRHEIVPEGKRSFRLQERIGRSIDSLHLPLAKDMDKSNKFDGVDTRKLVFKELTSLVGNPESKSTDEDQIKWLDMDVVDMTGLDTNIAGLRHSGFSLNGMLLKDLEELLTTGRRAMNRSTLVYREGNMFSYAHAPSFVSL